MSVAVFVVVTSAPAAQSGPLDTRVVAVANIYHPAEVSITAGDVLELTNLGPPPHDVVSLESGPDGLPLFASAIIGPGRTAVVEGVPDLEPGVFDFTCTLHPDMAGTLFVEPAA